MSRDNDAFRHPAEPNDAAAEFFLEYQQEILQRWVDAVMHSLDTARQQQRSDVTGEFAMRLQDIAEQLVSGDWQASTAAVLDNSRRRRTLQGRERSLLEHYTLGQLAEEYIILRRVVTELGQNARSESAYFLEPLYRAIEHVSLESLNAFAEVIVDVQQKLVGTLVHDVRTPLGVARTYSDMLSLPNISAEQTQHAVKGITRSLSRAQSMLEELLDAGRVGAGQGLYMQFKRADINEAVKTVCAEASQVYAKRVVCKSEKRAVMGIFDLGLVTRTLENLVSNAVKFGDKNAPITITLEEDGDYATLSVHNHGEPIPPRDINQIFQFFYSSGSGRYSSQKGWGLGLSLIKIVAKAHGGDVIAESSAEKGTTFGMVLNKSYRRDGDKVSALL